MTRDMLVYSLEQLKGRYQDMVSHNTIDKYIAYAQKLDPTVEWKLYYHASANRLSCITIIEDDLP